MKENEDKVIETANIVGFLLFLMWSFGSVGRLDVVGFL